MPRLARLDPPTIRGLAALAEPYGSELRLSAARTVTLLDLPAASVAGVEAGLIELGLITDPGSGWFGLSACSGQDACASAKFDVRAAAAARAEQRRPMERPEHWAGCHRSCGLPDGARLMGV
jgi:precorrin-3B synthase